MSYHRADFAPLRSTGYGIGFHWTTWTQPRTGQVKPFEEAVETFDVDALVEQVVESGAGHLVFPVTHALHYIPGPNAEVDKIIASRTCKRDLIMEIADALAKADIKLALYYHHGCDMSDQDPQWQAAVGGQSLDQTKFHDSYCKVVNWMSEHYGPKVIAYWFDACYGPMRRAAPPFDRWAKAAKAGYADRLIGYNAGIERHTLFTPLQDYWAGESIRLNFMPRTPLTPAGLPWYAYTSWHAFEGAALGGEWGMSEQSVKLDWPPPCVDSVVQYIKRFQNVGGIAAFNLLCYQDGSILESDLQVMKDVRKLIR